MNKRIRNKIRKRVGIKTKYGLPITRFEIKRMARIADSIALKGYMKFRKREIELDTLYEDGFGERAKMAYMHVGSASYITGVEQRYKVRALFDMGIEAENDEVVVWLEGKVYEINQTGLNEFYLEAENDVLLEIPYDKKAEFLESFEEVLFNV